MPSKSNHNFTISDRPTTKDSLGFEPYVIAIAEFLTHPETKPPLTLSIEGEWGSGKSSFMQQLEKEIKRKSEELDKYLCKINCTLLAASEQGAGSKEKDI